MARRLGAVLVVVVLSPLLLAGGAESGRNVESGRARLAGAPSSVPTAVTRGGRALQQYPFPKEAFDRRPLFGAAKGRRAAGQPDPVPGLATPDAPGLSHNNRSATMEDLVLSRGYPLETYPVETPDGYVLRLYRIPHGVENATGTGPKPVVLLHHGVTLASSCFVVLDPGSSKGFFLADAGFDVWMVNTRGNTFSKGNRNVLHSQPEYWRFAIDELALIDLPTQIDFVLSKTGQKSLALIGHSQGATLPLMLLAAKPEYNDKVWLLITEGPVAFAEFVNAPFMRRAAQTDGGAMLSRGGIGMFIPNTLWAYIPNWCRGDNGKNSRNAGTNPTHQYCQDMMGLMFAGATKLWSPDDIEIILSAWPSTVSSRNLLHWSQLFRRGMGLQMYNFANNCAVKGDTTGYDESCNAAKYGQEDPPTYDLSHVKVKAAVHRGSEDVVSTGPGIDRMLQAWGAQVVFDRNYPGVSHMDFVFARAPTWKSDMLRCLWDHAPRIHG